MIEPLTDEQCAATAALYREHGSERAAARAAGIARSTFKDRLRRAAERGLLGYKPVLPGFRVSQTTTEFDAAGNVTAEHVQQKPELGAAFEMPAGHVVKGVSALTDPDGRVIHQWIKTRTGTEAVVEALKAAFDQYKGRARLVPMPRRVDAKLLSVYPIADQHNGLLAWGRETGESYDLSIGCARLRASMGRLVAQSPSSREALIVNLGDWQHTDDQRNMTPHGHNILDVDSRYFKILTTGVRLMCDCIELALQRHANVRVVNIPGNHDPHASIALTVALDAFYSRNPRVTIEQEPCDVWFRRFGATLIGATHGHNMKPDAMAMSMAVRRRKDWGETKYHWFLFGHIHHETMKEVGDVRCESFQTLAAKDAHAVKSGYNAGQSLVSVTLHRETGEIGRHRVNIAPAELR